MKGEKEMAETRKRHQWWKKAKLTTMRLLQKYGSSVWRVLFLFLFLVLFRRVHSLNMRKYETIFHVYQTMEYTCYDITTVHRVRGRCKTRKNCLWAKWADRKRWKYFALVRSIARCMSTDQVWCNENSIVLQHTHTFV